MLQVLKLPTIQPQKFLDFGSAAKIESEDYRDPTTRDGGASCLGGEVSGPQLVRRGWLSLPLSEIPSADSPHS